MSCCGAHTHLNMTSRAVCIVVMQCVLSLRLLQFDHLRLLCDGLFLFKLVRLGLNQLIMVESIKEHKGSSCWRQSYKNEGKMILKWEM